MTETAAPAAQAPAWATTYTAAAFAALPADLTTATPPQVDEVIRTVQLDAAALYARVDALVGKLHAAMGEVKHQTEEVIGHDFRNRPKYATAWPTTDTEVLAAARALPAGTPTQGYTYGVETIGEILAPIDAAFDGIVEAEAVEFTCNAEFNRRGGWTRFYRVDNAGGHVHTTTACRTTYPTTAWQWPTNLSGGDGAQVVEYAGPLTCLVCFPNEREEILADRPVRFDMFETPEQRDERVRREGAAAELLAKKVAKGVTPDGKTLVIDLGANHLIGFGRYLEIKTERAAELRYVELAALAQTRKTWVVDADKAIAARGAAELVTALAWKQGVTAEQIVAKYAKKVTKKINDTY